MELCPNCGLDHHPELANAVAEVETAEVTAEAVEGAAHEEAKADVKVAEVEGATAIELAKIDAKVQAGWQEARVAELEGRLAGMEDVLTRLTAPPPEPEPEPAPVEVVEDGPPAPEEKQAPPVASKRKSSWF